MFEPLRAEWTSLRRSARLFAAFRTERTDPDGFYDLIAEDAVGLIEENRPVSGLTVLDVGGGPGYYARAFRRAGASCLVVDAALLEILRAPDRVGEDSVVGTADRLPVADGSVDVVFSSNMLEHVRGPSDVLGEMVRVLRPGGLLVVSYTNWLSPWGGHETSPWHYLGGHRAARRYARRTGGPAKNLFGQSLFALPVSFGLGWARSRSDLVLLDERPRYLPRWCRAVLRVPLIREVLTWNLWQVYEKQR